MQHTIQKKLQLMGLASYYDTLTQTNYFAQIILIVMQPYKIAKASHGESKSKTIPTTKNPGNSTLNRASTVAHP